MPAQLPHGSTWEDRERAVHRQAWQYHSDEMSLADDLLIRKDRLTLRTIIDPAFLPIG